MEKVIPIGYEDLKRIIDRNLYYVDKSLMIKDLVDSAASVNLFTRPRRFGKTLNLSMIRRFFEAEIDDGGTPIDNGYLFDDLAISECGQQYTCHQQQYPVINLSLKSAKQPDFEMAYASLVDEIAKEFARHQYVLLEGLAEAEKEQFLRIREKRAERIEYAKALEFLSACLKKYHHKNVIILIDEYDVPLENAYFEGFYDEMIAFVRSLFESALKTNPSLEFAVITGCLRISRESIFTGLNNMEIQSILSPNFGESFGFTQDEVKAILDYYHLEEKYDELKAWYDGYLFGGIDVYNPWSVLNYIKNAAVDSNMFPKPYWSNTSSNNIIRELVEEADEETRGELEELMNGKTIEKPVHEDITYEDIHESMDNLWNFLFFTGYLKVCGQRLEDGVIYLQLTIPNTEIRLIYRRTVMSWFDQRVAETDRSPLIKALEDGDCLVCEEFISQQLLDTISYFDYGETYYHGFLSGLLKGMKNYRVYSNRESGNGRPDIILKTPSVRGYAMVLELKIAKHFEEMESICDEALQQIKKNDYEAALRSEGYRNIKSYALCFYRKECMVKAV